MTKRRVNPKAITEEEFQPIKERDWRPVKLMYDALPIWMKTIPETQRVHVYASGSFFGEYDNQYEGHKVGGMDVFRDAIGHREGVKWNKDHFKKPQERRCSANVWSVKR
jgi:hypothetical protein